MENRFKKLRMELNPNDMKEYKVKDLSKNLGIAAPKISELEHGKRTASLSELQAYHKFFNVPYEYLLGENDSRNYENMPTSSETGLSSEAIEKIKKITQNDTLKQILNIFLEKYMHSLLFEISKGTQYMEMLNTRYIMDKNAREKNIKQYNESYEKAKTAALDSLQNISEQTGHIFRMITGNDNIDYCVLRASEIVRKAVDEILYYWRE